MGLRQQDTASKPATTRGKKAKEEKEAGTAVAAPAGATGTSLVTPGNNELLAMMQQQSGTGTQDFGKGDLAIPFLAIIQNNSPERDKRDDKYITDAEEGFIFHSITRELWEGEQEGAVVIPVAYTKVFNVWVKKDLGGGFRGSFATQAEAQAFVDSQPDTERYAKDPKDQSKTVDRLQVVETAQHFVLVQQGDGSFTAALLPLKSSGLKPSRNWNTLVTQSRTLPGGGTFVPPCTGQLYRMRTVPQKNERGSWFNVSFAYEGLVLALGDAATGVYNQANDFRKLVMGGGAVVDYSKDTSVAGGEVVDGEVAPDGKAEPSF
jgi:hypothetical protein